MEGRSASALQLVDSQTSRCAEVRTLDGGDPTGAATGSFLTRRLGLIVGSCMGCVVFLILIAVLSYTKIRQVSVYKHSVAERNETGKPGKKKKKRKNTEFVFFSLFISC